MPAIDPSHPNLFNSCRVAGASFMRFIAITLFVANIAMACWWTAGNQAARVAPDDAPEWVARVNVPQLKLLEEVIEPGDARQVASPLLEAAPRSCRMLGPVAEQGAATHLAAKLAAFGFSADVQPVEQTIGQSHWIYLENSPLPDDVSARHAILHARGIDSFIISEGPLSGHIAVGVYASEDAAAARLEEMRRRGLAPRTMITSQTQTEYWITVVPGPSHLITGSGWKSALHPDIPLQEKEIFCLDVASR